MDQGAQEKVFTQTCNLSAGTTACCTVMFHPSYLPPVLWHLWACAVHSCLCTSRKFMQLNCWLIVIYVWTSNNNNNDLVECCSTNQELLYIPAGGRGIVPLYMYNRLQLAKYRHILSDGEFDAHTFTTTTIAGPYVASSSCYAYFKGGSKWGLSHSVLSKPVEQFLRRLLARRVLEHGTCSTCQCNNSD